MKNLISPSPNQPSDNCVQARNVPAVLALPPDVLDDDVFGMGTVGDGPPPLGVKIAGAVENLGLGIGNLVGEKPEFFLVFVGEADPGPAAEGHGPVTVEGRLGVDGHGQGVDPGEPIVAHGEEVGDGGLDGGCILPVPIEPQDVGASLGGIGHQPDVLNQARPVDVHEGQRLTGFHLVEGTDFPSLSQVAGRGAEGQLSGIGHRHPSPPLLAAGILRRYRTRSRPAQQRKSPQPQAKLFQCIHGFLLASSVPGRSRRGGDGLRACAGAAGSPDRSWSRIGHRFEPPEDPPLVPP